VFADAFFIGHDRPIAVAVKRGDQLAIGEQSARKMPNSITHSFASRGWPKRGCDKPRTSGLAASNSATGSSGKRFEGAS
jgi:hypothetical protein